MFVYTQSTLISDDIRNSGANVDGGKRWGNIVLTGYALPLDRGLVGRPRRNEIRLYRGGKCRGIEGVNQILRNEQSW